MADANNVTIGMHTSHVIRAVVKMIMKMRQYGYDGNAINSITNKKGTEQENFIKSFL
jgi:phosphoribosylaminoimidazole carboxylase (NCAIR synthetase)